MLNDINKIAKDTNFFLRKYLKKQKKHIGNPLPRIPFSPPRHTLPTF